jgi:hypothetical protein
LEDGPEIKEERSKLERLHNRIVAADSKSRKRDLLRNGYMPQTHQMLIVAGLKCLPLIDADQLSSEPSASAIRRLKAIVAKICVTGKMSPKTRESIREFEKAIEEWDNRQKKDQFVGCLAFVILAILCLGGYYIWKM